MPFIRVKKCMNCGISHEWLFDGMTLQELRIVKRLTGMRAGEFSEAADEMDPDAIAAMIYILHHRDKISVDYEAVDLDFKDFETEFTEAELKEIEELEARMGKAAEDAQAPKVTLTAPSGPTKKAASKPK